MSVQGISASFIWDHGGGWQTLMLLALVVLLSLRLRKREMDTMFRLGCSRDTIVSIQLAEMGIIFFVALLLVAAATGLIWFFSADLVNSWLTANS